MFDGQTLTLKLGFTSKSISVAPQEPWIFEGTIKENILMGSEFDEKLYNSVTFVSSLLPDFEILPNGDQTVIGEKGVTLSGGQRARVGLARGLYVKADLYLLDDPLAAVDPEVAMVIYERAVQTFLKDKARILITHQHQFLSDADQVLYLDDGKQIAHGTYQQVMSVDSG